MIPHPKRTASIGMDNLTRKAFDEALDTLEQQAELLVGLMQERHEDNPVWRQNVTTVSANIADIYNEWLR